MNKRGQVQSFAVMFFVLAFITAVILATPIKDMVDTARNSANLDCSNSSISTGVKLTCVAVDITLPFFIITTILSGAGFIIARYRGG